MREPLGTRLIALGQVCPDCKKERGPPMNNHSAHIVDDIWIATKAFTVDLPLASMQWAFGIGKEETATTTAWQGYDASVRVATAVVDSLYRAPLSGIVFDRTLAAALRWHQLSNAVTGTVFPGFRQIVGMPAASAVHELEATNAPLAAEIDEQRDLQEVFLQQNARPSSTTDITQPRHIPKLRVRRHARLRHQLSLAAKQLAHQHGY